MTTSTTPFAGLRAGIEAFASTMQAIHDLPEFVLPGFVGTEDNSTKFNLPEAVRLLDQGLAGASPEGFLVALADYLQNQCGGVDVPWDDVSAVAGAVEQFGARVPEALSACNYAERVTLTQKRINTANAAAYEIELMFGAMQKYIEDKDACGEIYPVTRGMLARAVMLTSAIAEALDPKNDRQEAVGNTVYVTNVAELVNRL